MCRMKLPEWSPDFEEAVVPFLECKSLIRGQDESDCSALIVTSQT